MSLEVLKEKETPLLNRRRIIFTHSQENGKTLSRKDAVKEVAKNLNVNEDTIAIRHIYTKFGQVQSKIIVHAYKDAKAMEKYEDYRILVKQGLKEPKPKNAAQKTGAKPKK